jgi:5-(carboxyamino)imidazole ribonucleotide synthase
MVNLLGDLWARGEPHWEAALRADPGVKLHLYGKRKALPGRKMGHLTVLDADPDAALSRAYAARTALRGPSFAVSQANRTESPDITSL